MGAEIFESPKAFVNSPKMDFKNVSNWRAEEERYIKELKEFLLKEKTGEHVGEVISFPMADSSASYMVASIRPLKLVHMEIGDCWDFQYAHLLTAKEVKEKIASQKAMAKLFSH